jgi:hypothetical protein
MKFVAVSCVAGWLLAGCALTDSVVEDTSRDIAKDVVNATVQQNFPGANSALFTDCIIDNASVSEIFTLAQSAVLGTGETAASLVLEIAARPATTQCIAAGALASVLG